MSHGATRNAIFFVLVAATLTLSGCSGGGTHVKLDVLPAALPEEQIPTPEGQLGVLQVGERQALEGTGPHPGVVSTEPLTFGFTGLSPAHIYGGVTYIGSDVIPRIPLKTIDVSTTSSFRLSFGTLRDGMGDQRVKDYLANFDEIYPFRAGIHPRLRFPAGTTAATAYETFKASQILNAALPPESWITYTLDDPAPTLSLLSGSTTIEEGDVLVYHMTANAIALLCGADALACAYPFDGTHIEPSAANRYASFILLPNNLESNIELQVAVHEIIHALGFSGHTDSRQFPDSLMGTSGDYFAFPGYVIHDIDREALQAVYLSNYRNYNDLDTWDDATFHIRGDVYDALSHVASFGTAMRNGLPQPWAFGSSPTESLQDALGSTGTASWSGHLVGFDRQTVPIIGDATLLVTLGSLDEEGYMGGSLSFTNLETWGLLNNTAWVGINDENQLDYGITFLHSWFNKVSGDEGIITGETFGSSHEAMGGTLQRRDLTAAFGGTVPPD